MGIQVATGVVEDLNPIVDWLITFLVIVYLEGYYAIFHQIWLNSGGIAERVCRLFELKELYFEAFFDAFIILGQVEMMKVMCSGAENSNRSIKIRFNLASKMTQAVFGDFFIQDDETQLADVVDLDF